MSELIGTSDRPEDAERPDTQAPIDGTDLPDPRGAQTFDDGELPIRGDAAGESPTSRPESDWSQPDSGKDIDDGEVGPEQQARIEAAREQVRAAFDDGEVDPEQQARIEAAREHVRAAFDHGPPFDTAVRSAPPSVDAGPGLPHHTGAEAPQVVDGGTAEVRPHDSGTFPYTTDAPAASDPAADASDIAGAADATTNSDATDTATVIDQAKTALNDRVEAGDTLGGDPIGRAEYWHQQGDNDRQYEGTCALSSAADTLRACGVSTSENDIVELARSTDRCVHTSDDPRNNGGVWTGQDIADMMTEKGVDSGVLRPIDTQELAEWVEAGHGVLAEVSSATLWRNTHGASALPQRDRGELVADHVVSVTGTIRDAQGRLTDFVVNDTGSPDGAAAQVPKETFEAAWNNDRAHETVITTFPISAERIGR